MVPGEGFDTLFSVRPITAYYPVFFHPGDEIQHFLPGDTLLLHLPVRPMASSVIFELSFPLNGKFS